MAINNMLNTATVPVPVAKGGQGNASLTAYAPICGGTTTTGAVQSIASVGAAKQVLTSNGAGMLPTMQAQDFVLLGSDSISSSTASVEFTDLSADYFAYKFIIQNAKPVTDGVNLSIRLSTDNGATFISSASAYTYRTTLYTTAYADSSASSTFMSFTLNSGNDATLGFTQAEIILLNPMRAATYTTFVGTLGYTNSTSSTWVNAIACGYRANAEANNAIQFLYNSGNISAMQIRMYGIKNA